MGFSFLILKIWSARLTRDHDFRFVLGVGGQVLSASVDSRLWIAIC